MCIHRYILLILGLLISPLAVLSQGLVSDAAEWNFGEIAEEGGRVSHRFVLRNMSDEAIVIRNVRTSCGCTTSEYTRRPIVSGGDGELIATFDPRFRPGHFSKDIYIYSSASAEPTIIKILGVVTPRVESLAERYPYTLGRDSVRVSMLYLTVAPLQSGDLVQSSVEYINATSQPVEIEFRTRGAGEELRTFYDRGVAAGERSQIEIGYFLEEGADVGIVRRDTLDIFVNGTHSGKSIYVRGSAEE